MRNTFIIIKPMWVHYKKKRCETHQFFCFVVLFRLKCTFGPQVSQTCDFGPPIFKIAHLAPQVSTLLQNHDPPLILTRSGWHVTFFYLPRWILLKLNCCQHLLLELKLKGKMHKWCVISCDPFHSKIETQIELGLCLTPYTKTHSQLNRYLTQS